MTRAQSNEIQLRNIAELWRALGRQGLPPRPEGFEEAVRVYYDLAREYGAKYQRSVRKAGA